MEIIKFEGYALVFLIDAFIEIYGAKLQWFSSDMLYFIRKSLHAFMACIPFAYLGDRTGYTVGSFFYFITITIYSYMPFGCLFSLVVVYFIWQILKNSDLNVQTWEFFQHVKTLNLFLLFFSIKQQKLYSIVSLLIAYSLFELIIAIKFYNFDYKNSLPFAIPLIYIILIDDCLSEAGPEKLIISIFEWISILFITVSFISIYVLFIFWLYARDLPRTNPFRKFYWKGFLCGDCLYIAIIFTLIVLAYYFRNFMDYWLGSVYIIIEVIERLAYSILFASLTKKYINFSFRFFASQTFVFFVQIFAYRKAIYN